jgi:hypothetical protein
MLFNSSLTVNSLSLSSIHVMFACMWQSAVFPITLKYHYAKLESKQRFLLRDRGWRSNFLTHCQFACQEYNTITFHSCDTLIHKYSYHDRRRRKKDRLCITQSRRQPCRMGKVLPSLSNTTPHVTCGEPVAIIRYML